MRAGRGRVRSGVGVGAKLTGMAVVLALVPMVTARADFGDPPPPETHYAAGSGQLQGTELVEEQGGFPCFRATRTLFGLRGTGTVEGRTPGGDPVVYAAQINPGQTLYGDGPLQVQLENTEVYYHGPYGTHGTEAGGGAGCSPTTAGTPVPAQFRIFAAEGTQDTDGDSAVDVLTGAAWVYRLNDAGNKVPCVGQGSFARGRNGNVSSWIADWTLSADCIVVGNQGGTAGTGTAPRGTFMTDHGTHDPCFDYPCHDNVRVDYQQYLPKPGPFLRLTGPDSATVGCDAPVTVTARLTVSGWPQSGVAVTFSVAGPGPGVPAGGVANTDQDGKASFSFTAATAGGYTVTATATVDGTQVSTNHAVRFANPPPLSVALAGPERWQTEEQMTVTATVRVACGPLPGAQVDFSVGWPPQDRPWTGQGTPASGSALSGTDGQASFSFSGDRAGDYRVTASTRLPTGEQASDARTVSLEIRSLERVGAVSLPTSERRVESAAMDPAGRYAYFGAGDDLVRVDLATFQRVGAITLGPGGGSLGGLLSAAIDPAGRYAYVGSNMPGFVFKVDLATFEQVGMLALQTDEKGIESALIDPAGRFAYFGTETPDGKIVKVDLSTFTRVGAIPTKVGDQDYGFPLSAIMGPDGGYAYFATSDYTRAAVLKVDLATFQIADVIALPAEEYLPYSAVIDPAGDFAYFGAAANPGRVVKVDLRSFRRVGAITLAEQLADDHPAVIDPTGAFAYFGTFGGVDATGAPLTAGVVKVDLHTFQRVHAITLEPGASGEDNLVSAVVDPAGGYAYFGTNTNRPVNVTMPPDRVVKVQLKRPPNPALVAGSDAYAATAGTALTVPAPGVLANDHDTDGDPLQAGNASDPHGGSVTLNPDGSFTYTPNPDFAGTDTFTYTANDGMDYSPPATVSIQVAAAGVTGRALGYHAEHISLFTGVQPDTGPTPTVALAPDGSNSPQSASAPTGLVQYGPATLFTSDGIALSASVSPGGATITTSSAISDVNKATTQPSTGSEILTADRIQGACSATATAVSGSTTLTNGTVRTKAQDPNFPDEGLVTIPTTPSANYSVDGYVWLSASSQDHWRIVFNEQMTNPDGSITVNPVHEYFLGPILLGDMVLGQSVCRWAQTAVHSVKAAVAADFDGNGSTDRSVFRPSTGAWYVANNPPVYLGLSGDVAVPCDYDGNGTTDMAVFRDGAWYIGSNAPVFLGLSGDIPVPGDYDGNGTCDIAVYRPSTGAWYVGSNAPVFLGLAGDIPVPGDYDGDGTCDIAVYRPSTGAWYVGSNAPVFLGLSGDIPVPGDYDGSGKTEMAVFRPSTGASYVGTNAPVYFGLQGDVPVPGDYDGNGTTDLAVYRAGAWYVANNPPVYLGLGGDIPVPGDYDGNGTTDVAVFTRSTGAWSVGTNPPVYLGISGDAPLPLAPSIYGAVNHG